MPVRDLLSAASSQGAGPSDPYFYDVSLLLNGDGTNGAQNNTFLDSSSNAFTITRNGNTTQGSFSPYGTLWSNYFNGSSSLSIASGNTVLPTGTQDFSVEMWINWGTQSQSYPQLICNPTTNGFQIYYDVANGQLDVGIFNVANVLTYSIAESTLAGVWTHVAVTRSGNTFRLFVNGVLQANGTNTISYASPTTQYIASDGSRPYVGYLSNVRTVLGAIPTAYQTSSTTNGTTVFTPSTSPLTAVTSTALLTCQSNRFIDNSSNAFALTANGSPSVQRFSPFNPTAPYDTATIGGSMYANDNGYLSSTGTLGLGTGDFTVEGWVYPTTYTYSNMIACIGDDQTSTGVSFYTYQNSMRMYNSTGSFVKTVSLNLNSWNHVAWVRQSGVVTFYFNGVSAGTSSFSSNISSSGFKIGADLNSGTLYNGLQGYMSDNRIANSAIYTTTFTPPTAPLSAVSGTQLLCNMTNAGIPDLAMQNNLETVGNAQVSTSVKKYGTGSLYFAGGSSDYILGTKTQTIPQGPFTVEAWLYKSSTSEKYAINQGSAGNAGRFATGVVFSNWFVQIGSVNINAGSVSTNTWTHIAVTFNGSTLTLYVNGTSVGTASTTQNVQNTTLRLGTLGSDWGTGYEWDGYMDDIRISTFVRYTANFTPPTAALPTY